MVQAKDWMKPLEGNELQIFSFLEKGSRRFEELVDETHLSRPVVSKHLTSLQMRGLVFRNPQRKYEVLFKPKPIDPTQPNVRVLKSTELKDVMLLIKQLKWLPECTPDKKTQEKLLTYFVEGTFQGLLANIAKIIGDATDAKDLHEVQTIVRRFIDEYFTSYLQLLSIEAHNLRQVVAKPFWQARSALSESFGENALIEYLLESGKLRQAVWVANGSRIIVQPAKREWKWITQADQDSFIEHYAPDFPKKPLPATAKGLIRKAIEKADKQHSRLYALDVFTVENP